MYLFEKRKKENIWFKITFSW